MKRLLVALVAVFTLCLILSLPAYGSAAYGGVPGRGGVTPDNLPENKHPSKKVTTEFPAPEATFDAAGTVLTKIALIVGISDYYGSANDLNFCDDDARECYDTLVGKYGFPASNIKLLLDGEATDANIRAGIEWLIANSGPGSSVVFFYSGHGSRSNSNMDGDAEKQDECIVPWELSRIWDGNLAAQFARLSAASNWICFDSCYSGGMNDIGDAGEAVTMACAEKELSYESSAVGHGFFTYLMVERGMRLGLADADGDGAVSVEEAFGYASKNMAAYTRRQHPVMKDGIGGELVP